MKVDSANPRDLGDKSQTNEQILIRKELHEIAEGSNAKQASTKRFQNRSVMSLTANILIVANDGIGRTHLMYKANLSHRMLNSYLSYLTNLGLIKAITQENDCRTYYHTTETGKKYLEIYNSLLELSPGMAKFSLFHTDLIR